MKEGITMNKRNSVMSVVRKFGPGLLCVGVLAAMLSCEQPFNNPFKAGLGAVVDYRPPTIVIHTPDSGAYIRDMQLFTGHANDDYKLDRVEIRITNQPALLPSKDDPLLLVANPLFDYQPVQMDVTQRHFCEACNAQVVDWQYTINTQLYDDGPIKLQLQAWDGSGKPFQTDETIFNIKNSKPEIEMAMPVILVDEGGDRPGTLRGSDFNYRTIEFRDNYPRKIEAGGLMVGLITDGEKVYLGSPASNPERIRPQIRFWQVPADTAPPEYPQNVPHLAADYSTPWEDLPVISISEKTVMFRYPLPQAEDSFYAFEVKAYGNDGTFFQYPREYWPVAGREPGHNESTVVFLIAPTEYPSLTNWELEDITHPVLNAGSYTSLISNPDEGHPYIIDTVSSKSGDFTLRIRASHGSGINSAIVYFEREQKDAQGNTIRGRFIWDPADQAMFEPTNTFRGAYSRYTVPVDHVAHPFYSDWGLGDPFDLDTVRDAKTRSFIFTYRGDGNNNTDTTRYPVSQYGDLVDRIKQGTVKNHSKVQLYKGAHWERWIDMERDIDNPAAWDDLTTLLPEGTYNLTVIARAANDSMTMSKNPLPMTLKIDRQAPEIGTTPIEGTLGMDWNSDRQAYVVNGVVRPTFYISDSRTTDSQFRVSASTYFAGSSTHEEKRYIIVGDTDKANMDTYLRGSFAGLPPYATWPVVPSAPSQDSSISLVISGVTVHKHGIINDNYLYFKATNVHGPGAGGSFVTETGNGPTDFATLPTDNTYYRLYVLARDNAYNVHWQDYRIYVDSASDNPVIDFQGSINPNAQDPTDRTQFTLANGGAFSPNASLRMRLTDDDSLDMGESTLATPPAGLESKLVISFTGAYIEEGTYKIRPLYEDPLDPNYDSTNTFGTAPGSDKYRVQVPNDMITRSFPIHEMEGALRRAARERDGTILQRDMHDLLRANSAYRYLFDRRVDEGVLPDGYYRFTITVSDYNRPVANPTIKPVMLGESPAFADVATTTRSFWILVDTKGPQIDNVFPEDGSLLSGISTVMTGLVSDEQGPITYKDTYVTMRTETGGYDRYPNDAGLTWYNNTYIPAPAGNKPTPPAGIRPPIITKINLTRYVPPAFPQGIEELWIDQFQVDINMWGLSGEFDFYITFMDRLGNETPHHHKHKIDSSAPTVELYPAISTFRRDPKDTRTVVPFPDPPTPPSSPLQLDPDSNKLRLANKVISFTVKAIDNQTLEGVRWWLLPAGYQSLPSGDGTHDSTKGLSLNLGAGGNVLHYDAYPFDTRPPNGYPPAGNIIRDIRTGDNNTGGTKIGKYGESSRGEFTIYIDTVAEGLPDGEYRLHVIARDSSDNLSRNPSGDPNVVYRPDTNIQQEIFIWQAEDNPYFETISPRTVQTPTGPDPDVVSLFRLTGTVHDDDGFGRGNTVWAGPTGNTALDALPSTGGRTAFIEFDPTPGSGSGYGAPINITSGTTLAGGGNNLVFNIVLYDQDMPDTRKGPLESVFGIDGPKKYRLTVYDAPVNKWTPTNAAPGELASFYGIEDTSSRVFSQAEYEFIYDALAPQISLNRPVNSQSFGPDADVQFFIDGYLYDANLKQNKDADGNFLGTYTITYKWDSKDPVTLVLEKAWLTPTDPAGGTFTAADVPPDAKYVYFRIPSTYVTGTMLSSFGPGGFSNPDFEDSNHMLSLTVEDKRGGIGSVSVTFSKDLTPPNLSFTNIDKAKAVKIGDSVSAVGDWWVRDPSFGNEQEWNRRKWDWLNLNPLSVIAWDPSTPGDVPVLKGVFSDGTSDINEAKNGTSIEYWIDGKPITGAGDTAIDYNRSGREASWTIYLTDDFTITGTPLPDGVHTIRIRVKDMAGNTLEDIKDSNGYPQSIPVADHPLYAFRIDSRVPMTAITKPLPVNSVFGGNDDFFGTVIPVVGMAHDANLSEIQLRVVENGRTADLITPITVPINSVIANNSTTVGINFRDPADTAWPATTPLGNPPQTVWYNWASEIRIDDYPPNTFKDGTSYNVIAVARDQNKDNQPGNMSEQRDESIWTFTLDRQKPVISFDDTSLIQVADNLRPSGLNPPGGPNPANFVHLSNLNLTISGSANGTGSNITALDISVQRWTYGYNDTTNAILPEGASWVNVVTGAPDWITISTPGVPSGLLNALGIGTSADIRWTVDFAKISTGDGLYRMRVRAKDASTINGDSGWTITGDGNPTESGYVYFFYDRTDPTINSEAVTQFYSSRVHGGDFIFNVGAEDNNRIREFRVEIRNPELPVGSQAIASEEYTVSGAGLNDPLPRALARSFSLNISGAPDGHYNLVVESKDMAGRMDTETLPFTLDNTLPTGKIETPLPNNNALVLAAYPNGSAIVEGGQETVIDGWTNDTDPSGKYAESGMKSMWFHFGFLETAPETWPTRGQIEQSVLNNATLTDSGLYDNLFDTAAAGGGNAWFKLGGTPQPPAMTITGSIYDWKMSMPASSGGIKAYAEQIEIKGRQYNDGSNRRLVNPAPDAGRPGVVRMPLWIRIADRAGNVDYMCQDVLIYPDGDIPSVVINNPANSDKNAPRGGSISADGTAKNNLAVWSVIFRVKVDNKPDSPNTAPDNSNFVTLQGREMLTGGSVQSGQDELDLIDKADAGKPLNEQIGRLGWYFANLEVKIPSPDMPWSFNFNSHREITDRIPLEGFNSGSGIPEPGRNDMIRVWVEVFAFRGDATATRMSINDGTKEAPKPYTRYFYLIESAPEIREVMIGNSVNADDPVNESYRPGGLELRRGRFAVSATLDPGGTRNLDHVSIRRSGETGDSDWVILKDPVLQTRIPPGLSLTNDGGVYRLHYALDTVGIGNSPNITANPGYGLLNNGAWRNAGGRYNIELRIRDDAVPFGEALTTLDIGVDNFTPVIDDRYYTRPELAGSNEYFVGRAFDYDTNMESAFPNAPRKVDKVRVWLTKGTGNNERFVNSITGETLRINNPDRDDVFIGHTRSVLVGRNATVTGSGAITITVPPGSGGSYPTSDIRYPAAGLSATPDTAFAVWKADESFSGWVREISAANAADPSSRMLWSLNNNRPYDINWQIEVNTTLLPDGPITLHYIVYDEIGNASYYTQNTLIKNSYPRIDRITLYTDNNGYGAVYNRGNDNIASKEFSLRDHRSYMTGTATGGWNQATAARYGYLDTGFNSKNQYIGFKVETSSGSAPMRARLQYVTRSSVYLTATALQAMIDAKTPGRPGYDANNINLYTVAWEGGYGYDNWKALGVPITGSNNPPLGTHFVLTMDTVPSDYPQNNLGYVWKYTAILTRDNAQGTGIELIDPESETGEYDPYHIYNPYGISNPPILPNDPLAPGQTIPGYESGHGFNFVGTDHFNPAFNSSTTSPNKIGEFKGSRDGAVVPVGVGTTSDTAFFLIRVWDSVDEKNPAAADYNENDQLYDALVVGMNVTLKDVDPPIVRVYDLNPYTEEAVKGNNSGTSKDPITGEEVQNSWLTVREALDPTSTGQLGENILRGGLFNVSTEAAELVKSGHIEPRNGTRALTPYIRNPVNPDAALPSNTLFTRADGYVTGDGPVTQVQGAGYGTAANTYYNGAIWTSVTRDMVSGKIIIRGQAHDDQLIREIRVAVATATGAAASAAPSALYDPADTTYAVLKLDKTLPRTSLYYRTLQPVSGKQAWAFEKLDWVGGHTVEWAYVWDSETVNSGTPITNIRVWVAAIDDLGTNAAGDNYNPTPTPQNPNLWPGRSSILKDDNNGANDVKTTFAVDIVPYITGFLRYGFDPAEEGGWLTAQPRYVSRRSLQGWYSFYQGEQYIAAKGYNLGTAIATVRIRNGTSALTLDPPGGVTAANAYRDKNYITFAATSGSGSTLVQSGKIELDIGTTILGSSEVMNHRTRFEQSWNKEIFANTKGSDLWINRPHAHLWRSEQGGNDTIGYTYFQGSNGMDSPGLALQYVAPSGTTANVTSQTNNGKVYGALYGAWSLYGRGNAYYGTNVRFTPEGSTANWTPANGTGYRLPSGTQTNTNPAYIVGGAVDPQGVTDISLYNGGGGDGNAYVTEVYLNDGSPDLHSYRVNMGTYDNSSIYAPAAPTSSFQNSRVARGASYTYVSSYYEYDRRLVIGVNGTAIHIDGGKASGVIPGGGTVTTGITGIDASSNAGGYNAVDYDSTGPIVAYYDAENDTVRVALGSTANANSGSNWSRRYLLPTGHKLRRGSGKYISMKVDRNNGIHIAFYNSFETAIVYVYASSRAALGGATSQTLNIGGTNNFYAAIVDRVVAGGIWTDISVDNYGNPWITYGDINRFGGSYDGARIAYLSSSDQSGEIEFTRTNQDPVTESWITGWEAVQVSSPFTVDNERLNIEVWPPTDRRTAGHTNTFAQNVSPIGGWNAAVSYANNMLRLAFFYCPTYKDHD